MIRGIDLGMHAFVYANGGPLGAPWHSDPWTYCAPALWAGWRW